MIGHDRAQELAAAALDFELAPADRAELDRHLADCEPCRAISADLGTTATALAMLPTEDAPAHVREQILEAARIGAVTEPDSPAAGRPWSRLATLIPVGRRWPVALVASAAVIVALIGGTLAWQAAAPDAGTVAVASPSPTGPSGSGTPGSAPPGTSPTVEPGTDVVAGGWEPVAELTAGDPTSGVLDLDSSFRLASLDGTPPAELASRLTVEPPIEWTVTPETDGAAVRLTPKAPLVAGAVYRFTLAGPGGQTLDSWAFQARQPVRVVSTIPEDTATDVALDTGIEITFDQDGVADAASHVKIEPTTKGRFEEHGRVLAFVPDRLRPGTIYTITVRRGVTASPGGEPMATDVRFQFETAKRGTKAPITFQFTDDVFESATARPPVVSMWAFSEDDAEPKSATIDVYRLGGLEAAIDAFRQVRALPRWAQWSTEHLVPTKGLPKVVTFDARLEDSEGALWFRLPEALPAGWYLIQQPSATRPIQAILQVTDIASYLAVTDTKTLVWTNDLATGDPLAGATVAVGDTDLGVTDRDGLLTSTTPAAILVPQGRSCLADCIPVVTIATTDGRSSFLPATGSRDLEGKGGGDASYGEATDPFWTVLHTDRTLFRRDDTVNVWGAIRDRDTGTVPDQVELQLVAVGDDDGIDSPPISVLRLRPGRTGAFDGSIALTGMPDGTYEVQLMVDSEFIQSTWLQVGRILKPAYRLDVETGHRAYVVGDRIKVTVRASFYEGTPVPGVPLRVNGRTEKKATTDRTGTAVVRTVAGLEYNESDGDPEYQEIYASPRRAEEGQIDGATRAILVFPSSRTITAESEVRGGRVRVSGTVHDLDRDGLERDLAAGLSPWEVDPRGDPVRGTTVVAKFVELIPVKTRTGTQYDFIEKKVVPVYDYSTKERAAGTIRVKTDARGRFSASVPSAGSDHEFRVSLRARDPDGHAARRTTFASSALAESEQGFRGARLETTGTEPADGYGVGERIDLTMRDRDHPTDADSRYLFHVDQRGLRTAVVQSSPRFVGTLEPWAVPNVYVTGVRFTGTSYVTPESYNAAFRYEDRRIDVRLTVDKARYGPRDTVNVAIRTLDDAGKPIPATVILQSIDDKLFTIGGAEQIDPLPELYGQVGSGIRSSYVSHRPPTPQGEGGDTTGGGGDEGRELFKDSLLSKTVDTGVDGRGKVSFRLSDDLTSWRVLAAAFGADLTAGEGSVKVPVGLPFFVDASIAPEYLLGDRPSIVVRAFGTALEAGSKVTVSVTSADLGLKTGAIRAKAFTDVPIRLPALTVGRHSLTITARTGSGAAARTDRLTRTFDVVRSRLTTTRSAYVDLATKTGLQGGDGLTTVVVSDASAGRHVPLLTDLASGTGVRLERALAADVASSLLVSRFGAPEGTTSSGAFAGGRYQKDDGGLALVPGGASDLEVTSLAALVAPDRFGAAGLRSYLDKIRTSPAETRERRIYALAGLAGLGAPVLPEIRDAARDPDLTVRERLMLGIGAAAIGDGATARAITASLIDAYGEESDGSARLRVGDDAADISDGTALMAILAAAAGDSRAPDFWAYVEANPNPDAVHDLHAVAYVQHLLERLPPKAASFAYEIAGDRKVVELEAGQTFTMTVTATQLASLDVEPLTGSIGVTTDWREPVKASAFRKDPDITIRRKVSPAGTIGSDDLVVVDLRVRFGPKAPGGCHLVTDLVPSGLVPVGNVEGWRVAEEDGQPPQGYTFPFEQAGQRVSFCAEVTKQSRVADLRYVARVISPGRYIWEPAMVESRTRADRAALTSRITIRIR